MGGITGVLLDITLGGGEWVLYLLLLASIFSIAIMFERWWYLKNNSMSKNFESYQRQLNESLEGGKIERLINFARENSKFMESRVLLDGLLNAHKGAGSVDEIMEGRRITEKMKMERGLIFLGTLGNNAPFIGLFGTVLGIIKAFHDLASSESGGPSVVMAGISEALVATAVGLFVAIPAVIAFNYFNRRVKQALTNASYLENTLLAHLKSQESKK